MGNVLLDAATQDLQQGIDPVHFRLQLHVEASTTAWLLSLEVDTCSVMRSTPATSWFGSIALHLACLAKLAS